MLSLSIFTLSTNVPVIDVSSLRRGFESDAARRCIAEIGAACTDVGFFYVSNHGISEYLQMALQAESKRFFALPLAEKREIEMSRAGAAWRGYFGVGEELTSGVVDEKEGIYFAAELPPDSPLASLPLHGQNQFPNENMRSFVLRYMEECKQLAELLLEAVAASLGLERHHFGEQFAEPTTLFRIFHYPPHDSANVGSFAVGEHSDYGYLTLLKQDDSGGLQIKADDGTWVDAPPVKNTFVVNLGDALEHNTGGLYRATAHRVLQRKGATKGRYSFPFFFDPSFGAKMESVAHLLPPERRAAAAERRAAAHARWDDRDPTEFEGRYGEYLLRKVRKVFPHLASRDAIDAAMREWDRSKS